MTDIASRAAHPASAPRLERLRLALAGAVALGVVLRLVESLIGRGLHLDEAMLHWNLSRRSFAGLLEPLEWNQGAAILFLWIEKALVETLGGSEIVMRIWPELMGIGAVMLFGVWVWKHLEPAEAILATGVIAIGRYPILYTAFAKQYSTDLFVTLALYFLLDRLRALPWTRPGYWGLLFCGVAIVWLSHPSVFVIAGVGGALLVDAALRRDGPVLRRVGLFCAVTAAAFVAEYFLLLRSLLANDFLVDWWVDGFIPFPPTSLSGLLWFWDRLTNVPRIYTSTIALNVVIPLQVVGGIALYRRNRMLFALVMGPLAAVLIASAARQYPIHARLALFLFPLLAVLLGVGAVSAARALSRWVPGKAALAVVALALLLPEATQVAKALATTERSSDYRLLLNEVSEKFRPGDCLAVHEYVWPMFVYYREHFRWDDRTPCIVRYKDWNQEGRAEHARLRQNGRVWFLFVHGVQKEWYALVETYADANDHRLLAIDKGWGLALLYELND